MTAPQTVTLEGYFYVAGSDKKEKQNGPDLDRGLIDKNYILSARRFRVSDLHIVANLQRIQGSYFNGKDVQGVIDTKGSLIPFFIAKQKVRKLQELIQTSQETTNTVL